MRRLLTTAHYVIAWDTVSWECQRLERTAPPAAPIWRIGGQRMYL
ncbi:MAG: hypothetical protein V4558_13845 [Gemmatimonadota bacterium]